MRRPHENPALSYCLTHQHTLHAAPVSTGAALPLLLQANEDHNCYTFDMRKLKRATIVHKDHVSAVLDVA